MRHSYLLLATLAVITSLHAQAPTTPQRGPDQSAATRIPGVEVLPLSNRPFTGRDHITVTRTAEGGVSLTTHLEANVGRDSQGRVYRERHHFGPSGADPNTTLYETFVLDPIAHTRTDCRLAARRCIVTSYYPQFSFVVLPTGPFDNGQRLLTREALGNQTMEDLPVTGTRETITYAPGVIGNDQSIASSKEFWCSEDLKTNLAVTRKDPREGTTTIHLTIYSRAEPDPAIFAVPPGFTIQDARHSTN